MHHYRQALLRMRQGDSDRDIAAARVMGRHKAASWPCTSTWSRTDGRAPLSKCVWPSMVTVWPITMRRLVSSTCSCPSASRRPGWCWPFCRRSSRPGGPPCPRANQLGHAAIVEPHRGAARAEFHALGPDAAECDEGAVGHAGAVDTTAAPAGCQYAAVIEPAGQVPELPAFTLIPRCAPGEVRQSRGRLRQRSGLPGDGKPARARVPLDVQRRVRHLMHAHLADPGGSPFHEPRTRRRSPA
jgi:hypothetical protein